MLERSHVNKGSNVSTANGRVLLCSHEVCAGFGCPPKYVPVEDHGSTIGEDYGCSTEMCCRKGETHPGFIWFGEGVVCISKMIAHCLATIAIYRFSRYTVTFSSCQQWSIQLKTC